MHVLSLALLLAASPQPPSRTGTYLASLVDLPLHAGERMSAFHMDTWGVEFRAVCRFPNGWRVTAGKAATSDGVLEGQGSHGVTWLYPRDKQLRSLVLLTLEEPLRREGVSRAGVGLPATFAGSLTAESPDADGGRERPLTWRNLRLTRAHRCPVL